MSIVTKFDRVYQVNKSEGKNTKRIVSKTLLLILDSKDEYRVRGLYPLTAMMSHDCKSNTHHTLMDDMIMLVLASRDVPKGKQLTSNTIILIDSIK